MFGIGMPEMLLILAVALIVIGPKKLPDLAKSLGRAMGEFKKATSEIKESIGADADFKEVKETLTDIQKDIKGTVSFDNIEDYKPDPADSSDRPENLSPNLKNIETTDTDETLGDLKQAFDGMNQKDTEPPADATSDAVEPGTTPDDAMKEEPDSNERG
jgi:sec-independent protein translocase protein TatB